MKTIMLVVLAAVVLPADAAVGQSREERMAALCGDTMAAMEMPVAELQERATGCRKLLDEVKAGAEQADKVLLFRLEKCCNFFDDLLASKTPAR